MSSAEVRVKCLNDFGFDKRNVLAGFISRIEIAIAFDPGASDNANVRDFNECTTGLRVVQDWSVVAAYVPGTRIRLPIDSQKSRYDVVARFKTANTGEVFNGLTPIWCVRSSRLPAPIEGCFGGAAMLSCSITESVPCRTGGTANITCDGGTGTCKSCSTKDMACCEATKKSTSLIGGIVPHQSFDGGHSFTAVSQRGGQPASPHVDHHAIVSVPNYGPGNRVVADR